MGFRPNLGAAEERKFSAGNGNSAVYPIARRYTCISLNVFHAKEVFRVKYLGHIYVVLFSYDTHILT